MTHRNQNLPWGLLARRRAEVIESVLKKTRSVRLTAQILQCSRQHIYNTLSAYRRWLASGAVPELTWEQWRQAQDWALKDELDSLRVEVRVLGLLLKAATHQRVGELESKEGA